MNSRLSKHILAAVPVQLGFAAIDKFANTTGQTVDPNQLLETVFILSQAERVEQRMAGALFCVSVDPTSKAFTLLSEYYSTDPDWRIREAVAKAFDRLCKKRGYVKSLPQIRRWLNHGNPGMRRAASEGLRPWTNRTPFKEKPILAISLLGQRRHDTDDSVRLSVANALADISKKCPDMVRQELVTWDHKDPSLTVMIKRASRHFLADS